MRRRNTDDALKRRKSHRRRSVATRAAALQDEEATKPQPEPKNWEYKYLYDGACPVCQTLKSALEGTGKGEGKVWYWTSAIRRTTRRNIKA